MTNINSARLSYEKIKADAEKLGLIRRILFGVGGILSLCFAWAMFSIVFQTNMFDAGRLVALIFAAAFLFPAYKCLSKAWYGK